MISSWKLKQESVTSFCTEVLGVTSTFNHLNGWCPSLSLVSTFDFAGVFCIDLAVVGVTLMDCFLSSAIGSAGVFLPCRVNRLISDSSEWTKADTHSFSDWGKRGWRAWKLLVLYWPDVQGLSPFRSVMGSLLHRCTFMWLQFILFYSPFPSHLSCLPPAGSLCTMHGCSCFHPPSTHTNIHTYLSNNIFCKCV